jgi:hypothetical protein
MPAQSVNTHQGLAGTEPYGTVQGTERTAIVPSYIQAGTEPAFPTGNKYEGKQGVCIHIGQDHNQCRGPRAMGTDFCIGHLRAIEKMIKAQEAKDTENKE